MDDLSSMARQQKERGPMERFISGYERNATDAQCK